jgi:hypothetical protein
MHTFLSMTRHSSSDTKDFWLPREFATLSSLLFCCLDVLAWFCCAGGAIAGGCSASGNMLDNQHNSTLDI